jgi:Mrp family chromosome partitioning ATPase
MADRFVELQDSVARRPPTSGFGATSNANGARGDTGIHASEELSEIQQASTLRDYLQIARRRRGIILAVTALTMLSAAFFSIRQEKRYEASAQVLVRSGFDSSQPPERALQTQADLAAASPEVAQRVRSALSLETAPKIKVTPKANSNMLIFSSTATNPQLAARVATVYGREFSDFQRELATADIERELRDVEAEISTLNPTRARDRALYASLLDKREELRTLDVLQTQRALLVRPATPGVQVQPKPLRDTLLGLALGLVLGVGLASLREALDTRVRSTDDVAAHLGVPLLARVPRPPRRLRREDRLVMISDPDSPGGEAFRILRANVDFARIETDARTLLVTSAVEGEGKSTTAANLAVALARAGQRVVLIDLDLRRPSLHRFFDLTAPGIAQLAIGGATLEEALAPIPLVWPGSHTQLSSDRNGARQVGGMLHVLPAGPIPGNVDDVLTNQVVAGVLENLRENADIVVIDSTPLVVGDAMALTAAVDAVLIVTRMDLVRRPTLRELRRILDTTPTRAIGFVATGVESGASYTGYAGYYVRSKPPLQEPVA